MCNYKRYPRPFFFVALVYFTDLKTELHPVLEVVCTAWCFKSCDHLDLVKSPAVKISRLQAGSALLFFSFFS